MACKIDLGVYGVSLCCLTSTPIIVDRYFESRQNQGSFLYFNLKLFYQSVKLQMAHSENIFMTISFDTDLKSSRDTVLNVSGFFDSDKDKFFCLVGKK